MTQKNKFFFLYLERIKFFFPPDKEPAKHLVKLPNIISTDTVSVNLCIWPMEAVT